MNALRAWAIDLREFWRNAQAHLNPVRRLVAHVVQLAPCQLEGQHVRGRAFGQGGRADDRCAISGDRPGNEQPSALAGLAEAGHQPVAKLDAQSSGSSVQARDVGLAETWKPMGQVVRGQEKLENPHAAYSIPDRPSPSVRFVNI